MLHLDTSVTINDDKIWMDGESKLHGICREVRSLIERHWDVLILAHFERELQAMSSALRGAEIAFKQYTLFDESAWSANNLDRTRAVWLGLARSFQPRAGSSSVNTRNRRLSIIVAEHHPLRDRDERIHQAAQNLPGETHVSIHAALTDPLLVHFGGEQIGGLVRQLGMGETCLSNQMINTAIRRSQEKIAKLVTTEIPTLSAKDWFKYNLPNRP